MSTKRKIYIAGPMSGYPEFNFPAFHKEANRFRRAGWLVFNPAEKESEKGLSDEARETGDSLKAIEKGFDFREVFTWDLEKVVAADAIYMLRGWQYSPGATAEHAVAVAMKKHYPEYQIFYEPELVNESTERERQTEVAA